ncbi:uncharacterized protein LOC110271999 [Arachis ipaensis]|uniref:uncharacterized protein LOC110271999 n=1 Tax=Arachis ipaensis TaxID=130454 RepID=UPI000A2B496B|nr:uncharacterized protein LOC110271999 [Arachis ipaensis]
MLPPVPTSDTTVITTGDHRRQPLSSLSSLFLLSFSISPQFPVRYPWSLCKVQPQCNPAAAELCAAAAPPLLPLSFHSSPFTNVIECTDITGSDDTDLVDELPDHSCLVEDEILRVGMRCKYFNIDVRFNRIADDYFYWYPNGYS